METVVQTFELKEVEELTKTSELSEQWKAAVEDLGLKGQLELLTEPEDNATAPSPVPYLWLNERQYNVLQVLCPKAQAINDYAKMPIPLEILGHVKQCELKKWFKKIEVWYDDRLPDPVVVGVVDGKTSDEDHKTYLIGRWGAEAMTLEQLDAKAVERKKEQLTKAIQEKMAEGRKGLENIDSEVDKLLNGDYTTFTYWH